MSHENFKIMIHFIQIFFSTDYGQSCTPFPPKGIHNDKIRNKIYTALIVTSIVAVIFCLAYLILLASEKYLKGTLREGRVLDEIMTAWFGLRLVELHREPKVVGLIFKLYMGITKIHRWRRYTFSSYHSIFVYIPLMSNNIYANMLKTNL